MLKLKDHLKALVAMPASSVDSKGILPEIALRDNDKTTSPISLTSTKMIMNTTKTKRTNHWKMQ
jgi:hypothetical protein